MLIKILADESVDYRLVKKLAAERFEVISVLKEYSGVPDKEVLQLARKHKAILLTEDSDFGEWIFSHKYREVSVIFLRYKATESDIIYDSLLGVLKSLELSAYHKFIVITTKKVRIREIP